MAALLAGLSFRDTDFRDAPERAAAHLAARGSSTTSASTCTAAISTNGRPGAPNGTPPPQTRVPARLTSAELDELREELLALARKYDEKGRAAEAAGDTEGRENVALHMYGFPFRI